MRNRSAFRRHTVCDSATHSLKDYDLVLEARMSGLLGMMHEGLRVKQRTTQPAIVLCMRVCDAQLLYDTEIGRHIELKLFCA